MLNVPREVSLATENRCDIEPNADGIGSSCEISLQACSQELSALLNLAQDLGGEIDTASLLRKALQQAVTLLGYDGGLIWQTKAGSPNLRLADVLSLPPAVLAATPTEWEMGVGASGQAVTRREPALVPIEHWSGPEQLRSALQAAGVKALLGVPLLAHGHVMGAMVLFTTRRRPETFTPDVELAATLGTVVGVALAHAQEHAALIQEERLAALGRMAAGVIHELKSPLTVLLGRTELLLAAAQNRTSLAAEEVARRVRAIHDAGQRMSRLVGSLSLYSKPPKAEIQTLDVLPLFAAIEEMVEFAARKANVTLRVETPAPAGLRLLGDRSHLLQVLLNLVTNAVEAVGQGGVVTLSGRPGGASELIIKVADNGPGIPPELQERIWEPFFTTKPDGTGLGLAIARSLVKEMGGTIRVESEPGRGTRFRMSFRSAPEGGVRAADDASVSFDLVR